jgi:glycosyltransferase involved in cell wall biosynthesis
MKKELRISFVIPFTGMTGGIAVVLEYCRQLKALGHKVNIYYPLLPYRIYHSSCQRWKRFPSRVKMFLYNIIKFKRGLTLFSENIPIKPVVAINNIFIPSADAVIATAWPTAYDVASLSMDKGHKYYFVQDYEIWHGCVDTVDNSYLLPINIITIAPWLTELMKEKIGCDNLAEIHNGIRLDKFYPPAAKDFDHVSILMMAHDMELKGTADGIDALTIVKKSYPQVKIKMFGMCGKPDAPFDFEYHQDPSYEKLLSLYQNATIFLSPSHKEGWGLPPMEAMACKCAVVATNTGCIPILYNGQNLIIVEAGNPLSLTDGIVKLIKDKALIEKTAEEGLKRIREQGWDKSVQKLHNVLASSGS